MATIKDIYQEALNNKIISNDFTEQQFEQIMRDDKMRRKFHEIANQSFPNFYPADYDKFAGTINSIVNTVADNPAPTNAQEDSINLAKQNEGEMKYNISTPPLVSEEQAQVTAPTMPAEEVKEESAWEHASEVIDNAWEKSGFLGKVFMSPLKLAELGVSVVQGIGSGAVEWGGKGSMALLAQATENNLEGEYNTLKVDAMGNPLFVPTIGEDGKYKKAGYTIEEQIEAAQRVAKAEAEGKEADAKDKNASMYVRAANKLGEVADRLYKDALPKDIAEDATFIDLIRDGEIMDAIQLSVASTGQSIPYMLLNSLPGGAVAATALSQANTYLDMSQEHPDMEKWKRYTYAIGSAGIEQAIEKFTNPFKGLKGASKKEVAKTLQEITDGAEKAIWKRIVGNVAKEAAGEGGEELATSVFTDIFGTMIDVDGEHGVGLIGQYNEYASKMKEQNPRMSENEILKSFVGNKTKEYAESFIMGALSGAYISTASSLATSDVAKEEQKKDKVMLSAIINTANESGLSRERVMEAVMNSQGEQDMVSEEDKQIASSFRNNYRRETMRSIAEEQGNEFVKKVTNKTDGFVYEVAFNDGSLGDADIAYIVDGKVATAEVDGQLIIDKTGSDDSVYVMILKEDGTEEPRLVSINELDLTNTPSSANDFALEYQKNLYDAAESLYEAQQQVEGEEASSQISAQNEQASNIEGRQFTNGQQTITASPADSNGNVRLSSPIELPDGSTIQEQRQDVIEALLADNGWQEVTTQPTPQPQATQPIVWGEMDAEQATAAVVERSKGNKERAKKFAEAQVKVKEKALKDAQKELDQVAEGGDIDAFNAAQDKVDAIQAEVDKWSAVANGVDAYQAPQPAPQVQASASGNGVVTEGTARQSTQNQQQSANNSQNTLQNGENSVPLQGEKSAAQKVIDKIDGGQYKTLVFNDENIEQQMRDAGFSEKSIAEVLETIKIFGAGAIDGFFDNNVVFVYENQSEDKVRIKYVHERQHGLNEKMGNRKRDVVNASSESQLKRVVRMMAGNDFYDKYNHLSVADEFICRAMEIAYSVDTDAELEAELRKYGANEQLIQIIKDLNNEQRKDTNLGKARKSSYVAESANESSREGERDSEEISRRVLGREGSRSSQTSERGDRSGRPSEVTQDTALEESGIQVNDETGDARFSVNYRLDANQIDILAEQIAERVGVSKTKAKKWLKAETSLAALCLQEDNVAALYYFADGRYGAIKNNSDYPQGTVDFNNICRKRLDFTNIYLSLQREFPNKVFTAKDLETIRQIMIEDGLEVACGLCYVEDRRQLLGEIANEFRGFLKDRTIPEDLSATKKEVMQKVLDMVGDDTYIPTIAQLLEAGAYELRNSHPSIFEAFVVFNNSRGMQSGRLFEGYAEYKREILDWSGKKVKQVNDAGGLRIFSFSDFEAHHLIDIVQIISDAASKGVMIQGYTKVPEFARAIRNTKVKLNRSLIPLGDAGIQEVDGKKVLAYDTTEGINVNSENFLDESNNPNVGNVLVGINDEQIRMAMDDTNVDYIIPFHTGLKKDILLQKKIGAWVNYKNSQTEKDATTGSSKTADGKKVVGVNIYTDVLQAAEKEGTPIKNRKEFVEYFLKVCKERGLVPRFEQFLARGKNGEYKYTKGYEKLLVDFKMFDKRGNILPQEPVVPIFDDAFNQQIIEDYVKGTKETKEYESTKEKIKENLQLNDYTDDLAESESQVRYSIVTDKKKIEELENSEKMKGYRTVILNEDGTFSSPMATGLGNKGKTSAKTSGFELGKWEQAEERPELADENGKINLKPKEGGDTYVDYNPYIHNRLDKINTQFTSAWRKPFLVYIETEIPMSDIESGYHAEKAALSVGVHPWNGGDLVLSRYDKPVRIVPWDEVADAWAEQYDEVTFDIVNPELLPLLHERGVKILPPKKAAKEKALAAYEQWKAENSDPRFSISSIAEDAWNKYQYDGELESIRDVANYIEENMPKNEQTQALFDAIDAYNIEELEDRELYGMRGDLEPFEDAILEELETLMNSKPRFSITAEEDKAYADAVARGDMETAQDMLRDAAERAGYAPLGDYKDSHQAPSATVEKEYFTNIDALQEQLENGNVDSNLFAIAQGVSAAPQDYFSPQGARWYGYGNLSGMESYVALASAMRSIQAQMREYGEVREMPKVKVYRAVPKNIKGAQLESEGQWVSPSREYAVGHGRHRFGFNQYRIVEQEVPADQLWWDANDIREWGFDDGTVNAYQNTKNNRKLYEVTYDDNGELITLSKRFDKRKADVRFSVTAQEDAAYMDAVNRGDMEAAQRMVNEAAKKAGYTIEAYHGTDKGGFTVFDNYFSDDKISFFFSDRRDLAKTYTESSEDINIGDVVNTFDDAIRLIQEETDYRVNTLYTVDGKEFFDSEEELLEYWELSEDELIKEVYEVSDGWYTEIPAYDMATKEDIIKLARTFIKRIAENGEQQGIYPLYLKIEDPYKIDAKGGNWDDIYEGDAIAIDVSYNEDENGFTLNTKVYETPYEGFDYKTNSLTFDTYEEMKEYVEEEFGYEVADYLDEGSYEGVINWDDKSPAYPWSTREIAEGAKEIGCDGVIIENVWDNGGYAERQGLESTVYILFDPNKIKSANPVTYDDNGNIIPLSERFNNDKNDIRFSLSNTNQRIFVSNAERAVESIKQDKATPQQWKAMIEKQGGLKAGEDKWLGLSEWLDSKVAPAQENETMGDAARRVAKNTITKQEILDYIDEHQIQIEEVEYINKDDIEDFHPQDQYTGRTLEELQYEVDANAESSSRYDAEDEDGFDLDEWLMDVMVNEYGEDFSLMYTIEDGYIEYNENFEDSNNEYDGKRFINDTRLRYVTIGLKNYQEIALTVPTIERWNEGDEIHFGDAGNGRAIAWIRFGETEVQTPREVIDHVDELQFAYTNANGQDVYAPQGSKFSKDYAVYGKLANGEMGYVLYVRNNQLSAHPTLEAALEALNAHYEANPRQVTDYDKVLVIDEIQSKRHQEGREKGYATKKDRDIKKKIAKLTDQQDAIFDAMRAREEGRAGITNFTEEETAELKRLGEEIKQLQSELSANNGIIPDAPFDKNWHELAFKRMLRYAAENGYDYVAWTTGEQQAERYDLGKQFDYIEREDNPSINGRRFALNGANYFTFVVNEEGIVTESDMSEIQGKPLADVVGKDLAIRMMSLEDGDAIENADLRIGGEGMKGFYDKMLPSFVSKYTKKWGAKVQDINLPSLEESAQTMHAVNVTQEMKDSVMDGQVMFSVRNRRENLRNWEESSIFAEQYRFGEKLLDSDYIDPLLYEGELDTFNEVQEVISKVTDDTPLNQVIDAYNAKAKVIEQFLDKVHSVTTPVHVVASIHTMMQDLRKAGISGQIAREIYNERIEERKYGIGALGFVYEGHVYIMAEHMPSLSKAQLVYGHELQHVENRKNEQLLIDVIRVAEPKELLGIAESLGGEGYADNLDDGAKGYITLADEAIAFAIEYGYMLGNNGNLAAALKRDGLKNEKLINLLQKEYERRKENTNLALNKIKRNESDLRSDGVGVQQDARTQEGKPRQVFEWKGFVDSSDPRSQLGKSEVEALRREAISELESRKDVPVLMLERVRFSISSAPTPNPNETKGEYTRRFIAWRDSQVDAQEVDAYKQLLNDLSSRRETLYRQWVDRNRPIEHFQEWLQSRGGKITSYTNAFADMTRSKGRVQTATGEYEVIFNGVEAAIKDIINSKRLKGIHLTWKVEGERNGKQLEPDELIGVYCQAMDVDEAKRKGLQDRGEAGFKKNLRDANGNEVSYEDVIRMVHSALAGTNLKDNLWTAVNEATKFALKYQLAAGMIDQKTFDKFNRDHYVPERGWRERDMDGREYHYNKESGDLNGSPYNAALAKSHGRESLASDPFAYIKSIAISSIMSAEKNRTKQMFLQMLLDNEEIGNKSGAWKIRRVYLVDDGSGNTVLSYIKPADESKLIKGFPTRDDVKSFEMKLNSDLSNKTKGEKKQHLVSVVRDGVPYLIELESELVARALNRDYPQRDNVNFADRLVRKLTKDRLSMRSLTGFASSINTQHNPEFAPSNFIRDFFFANTKILMEHKDPWEALKRFNKNIAIMLPAVVRYVTTTSAGRRDVAFAESRRGKILKRFFEEGAQTGWSYLEEVNALREKIRKNLYKTKARKIATIPINVVLQMYSFLSEVSELSVRVAMFATEIELGKKPMDAAHNAKEITTNFDTKGEFANEFGVLWSFFNATIQGSNSLYRAVKKGKKRAFGVLGGVSAFMFALGYIVTILQPDDPDEETMWNDYIRQTNIVIGKYKIPVMHFFRMFYAGGVNLALRHQGRKTKTESYYDAFQAAANEVIPDSPLRVQGLLVYDEKNDKFDWSLENYLIGLTPSIASPMVEAFVTNENFMGGKIDKEPYPNEEGIYKKRHYTKVQDNEDGTRHPYNLVADWISGNTSDNDLVGEDDWSPLVDISGSQLRHIVRGYTGGAGSFSEAAYEFGRKIAVGEELSRDDVPIIRKFTKGYNGESAYTNEFYKLYRDIKVYEQRLKYLEENDLDAYYKELGSQRYNNYLDLEWLVEDKPQEGDTHTPAEVKQLMEANKKWRQVK